MNPRSQNSIFSTISSYGDPAKKIANQISKNHVKLANTQEQLKFNLRCKKNDVIPKSLMSPPPIRTPGGFRIAKNTAKMYLQEIISNCHYRIGNLLTNILDQTNSLANIIPENVLSQFKTNMKSKLLSIRSLKK